MVDRDTKDYELQVAAVVLWERLRSQAKVGAALQKLYPDRGAIDHARVSRLCKFAVQEKFARPASTARLVGGPIVDKWLKLFQDTERRSLQVDEVEAAVKQFCIASSAPITPVVFVVSGDVAKPRDKPSSEFAANAADLALKYLADWSDVNRGLRLRLGVTWGRQLHYVAVAARNALLGGYLGNAALSIMPLVGLPIGGHRRDIMSSSEIARELARSMYRTGKISDAGDEYDLQLVPAYLPEKEFSEKHLPALYRLLYLTQGWTKIFGAKHMTHWSDERPTVDAPEVFDCNFIWSSVSDISEPFGFNTAKQESMVPFAYRPKRKPGHAPRPVADCGGIPLWDVQKSANFEKLEASFKRRWTGIRRNQWRYCVQQGIRTREADKGVCGAVLFAPTAEKAQPVLYAIRDGLANVIILGRPCADRVLQILK